MRLGLSSGVATISSDQGAGITTIAIHVLLVVAFGTIGACGSGDDTQAPPSAGRAPEADSGPAVDEPVATAGPSASEPAATFPEVSRTRQGNGGVIAVAGEMTMEFDYSAPQGRCQAADGKFAARGIGINDDNTGVSIRYETIVAPDTGKVVGSVFGLEVRKGGYVPWVAQVGTGRAGSIEEISQDVSPGGGVVLTVTGTVAGFQKNRAPTGVKAPFRLEATCGP